MNNSPQNNQTRNIQDPSNISSLRSYNLVKNNKNSPEILHESYNNKNDEESENLKQNENSRSVNYNENQDEYNNENQNEENEHYDENQNNENEHYEENDENQNNEIEDYQNENYENNENNEINDEYTNEAEYVNHHQKSSPNQNQVNIDNYYENKQNLETNKNTSNQGSSRIHEKQNIAKEINLGHEYSPSRYTQKEKFKNYSFRNDIGYIQGLTNSNSKGNESNKVQNPDMSANNEQNEKISKEATDNNFKKTEQQVVQPNPKPKYNFNYKSDRKQDNMKEFQQKLFRNQIVADDKSSVHLENLFRPNTPLYPNTSLNNSRKNTSSIFDRLYKDAEVKRIQPKKYKNNNFEREYLMKSKQ